MNKEALLNAIYAKRSTAFKAMTNAEADGNSNYAYWSGVVEGLDEVIDIINKWNEE